MEAHNYAIKNNYDWYIYLDADEFIVLNNDLNISSFLEKYHEYDQVGLNWLMFGTNYHSKKPTDSILASYTRCDEILNIHIKSFIHLLTDNTINNIINTHPHVNYFVDMSKSVGVDKNILSKETPYWYHINKKYNEVPAYVAHFAVQSYETYIQRKISIPRDDSGIFRELISEDILHTHNNNFENDSIKTKYDDNNKTLINMYKK